MKRIYKITYPNGKIYIGKDLTGDFGYFGSVNSKILEADFNEEQRLDFTIRREIIWKTEDNISDSVVNKKETEFIKYYKSNNPSIGYNRWPKYKE